MSSPPSLPAAELPEPDETPLYKFGKGLYNTGLLLLHDDKMDIGYTIYYDRPHYYNGQLVKDHPSFMHHWPFGIAFMFAGQMMGVLDTLLEMKRAMQEDNKSFNNQLEDTYSR